MPWTLVAERGFPSAALFAPLRQGHTACSGRLRLSDWGTGGRVYPTVAASLEAGRLVDGPRTARERSKRAKAYVQHRAPKQGRQPKPPSAVAQRSAPTWVLCTTAPTVAQAVAAYAPRMPIEETFRDWPSGWGVRAAVAPLPSAAMVDRLSGVVCLPYSLQMYLGHRVNPDPVGQQRRAQWTVTDRVRWFWCGQRLFDDPGHAWRGWLAQQWESLGRLVTPTPATPVPELVLEKAA